MSDLIRQIKRIPPVTRYGRCTIPQSATVDKRMPVLHYQVSMWFDAPRHVADYNGNDSGGESGIRMASRRASS
jgi:hypothetical protein